MLDGKIQAIDESVWKVISLLQELTEKPAEYSLRKQASSIFFSDNKGRVSTTVGSESTIRNEESTCRTCFGKFNDDLSNEDLSYAIINKITCRTWRSKPAAHCSIS